MQEFINQLPKLAKDKHNENKKFFTKLKKKPPKNLDGIMQELHTEEFQKTDCLECANCCKTTGPLFTDRDVDRIAKHLKMKSYQFEEQYLRKDEDCDFDGRFGMKTAAIVGGLPLLAISVLLMISAVRATNLDLRHQDAYIEPTINIEELPDMDPWSAEGMALAQFEKEKDAKIYTPV